MRCTIPSNGTVQCRSAAEPPWPRRSDQRARGINGVPHRRFAQRRASRRVQVLEEAASLFPDLPDTYINWAGVYQDTKDFKKAEEIIQIAVKRGVATEMIYTTWAAVSFHLGGADASIGVLSDGLRKFAHSVDLVTNLAQMLSGNDRNDEAMSMLDAELREPALLRSADVMSWRGRTSSRKGQTINTVRAYMTACRLDGAKSKYLLELATTIFSLAAYPTSERLYRAVLKRNITDSVELGQVPPAAYSPPPTHRRLLPAAYSLPPPTPRRLLPAA